jgi:hypothetical protein
MGRHFFVTSIVFKVSSGMNFVKHQLNTICEGTPERVPYAVSVRTTHMLSVKANSWRFAKADRRSLFTPSAFVAPAQSALSLTMMKVKVLTTMVVTIMERVICIKTFLQRLNPPKNAKSVSVKELL